MSSHSHHSDTNLYLELQGVITAVISQAMKRCEECLLEVNGAIQVKTAQEAKATRLSYKDEDSMQATRPHHSTARSSGEHRF